jgi:hypothetical protein
VFRTEFVEAILLEDGLASTVYTDSVESKLVEDNYIFYYVRSFMVFAVLFRYIN